MDSTSPPEPLVPLDDGMESDPVKRQALGTAIATELAPEVAIALLAKTEKDHPSDAEAALKPLAAGVTAADDEGKIRLQLLFQTGAVLPVELDKDASQALIEGLQNALDEAADKPPSAR